MSRRRQFSVCALLVLSTVPLAYKGQASADPADIHARESTTERGKPTLFSWGDIDGDGRLDLAAVGGNGTLQLLINAGEGRFEDMTERLGLTEVGNATVALWGDYDGDGLLDLFLGAREGQSRLFHNDGGAFIDMTASSGLAIHEGVQSAHWFDHDGDRRLDLFVVTASKNAIFRGLEGGFFELAELPLAGAVNTPGLGVSPPTPGSSIQKGGLKGSALLGSSIGVGGASAASPLAAAPNTGSVISIGTFPISCALSIRDQASAGACLAASTTPTLGMLYPISSSLFVAVGGNVGVGTTSPAAKLHVAGTARMTDTLTLNPSGDQALNVSTGNVYKGGAKFLHTNGGPENTALGIDALSSITTGNANTGIGYEALRLSATGHDNTAIGVHALLFNTSGHDNTALGSGALFSNTTGDDNTALGQSALSVNSTGIGNIAVGHLAGANITGNDNIDIGNRGVAGDVGTIRIGDSAQHTRAFISGIRGVTTANANAVPVLVDSAGQLGTVSSSRRFKEDIADMGSATERLLELRPVVFHYKQVQELPDGGEVPLEYGLIAEEVAEVFPDLVVNDEEGKPFTVKYHLLSSMLLNELKKQARELARLRGLEARLVALEEQVAATAEKR